MDEIEKLKAKLREGLGEDRSENEHGAGYKSFEAFEVGEAIRKKRKEQGLSENALAELVGVSRSTIQKVEAGSDAVNLNNLRKVMMAVGLELAWR